MSTARSIFSGLVGGLLMTFVSICLSFLQLRILLHHLPGSIVGIWLIFTNLGAYVLFLDFGLTQTLSREISFTVGAQDVTEDGRARTLATLIITSTRVLVLLASAVYPFGVLAGWLYLRTLAPSFPPGQLALAWALYFAAACLNLVGEGWFAGIYGTGRVFSDRLIRTGALAAGFCFMLVAIFSGWGIRGLAAAALLQSACSITAAWATLHRLTHIAPALGRVDFALIRRLAPSGLKYAATVLGGVLILQTDNLVIASTLGPAMIPNYQAVAKIVTTFMSLSMMLVVITSPFMSRAHAQQNTAEIRRLLRTNQQLSLSVLIILGSCLACFADRVISLWLGPNHFIGFGVVWALLAMMCLEAHHVAMATATMATGRIVFVFPALLAGVFNILLSVFLARRIGVLGVALGTLVAQLLTNNWYVPFYVLRQFHIPLEEHLRRIAFPMLVLVAATLTTGFGARRLTHSLADISAVLLGCLPILCVGAVLFCFFILEPSERLSLFRLAKTRLSGDQG